MALVVESVQQLRAINGGPPSAETEATFAREGILRLVPLGRPADRAEIAPLSTEHTRGDIGDFRCR